MDACLAWTPVLHGRLFCVDACLAWTPVSCIQFNMNRCISEHSHKNGGNNFRKKGHRRPPVFSAGLGWVQLASAVYGVTRKQIRPKQIKNITPSCCMIGELALIKVIISEFFENKASNFMYIILIYAHKLIFSQKTKSWAIWSHWPEGP
jgi:hypothetical protein